MHKHACLHAVCLCTHALQPALDGMQSVGMRGQCRQEIVVTPCDSSCAGEPVLAAVALQWLPVQPLELQPPIIIKTLCTVKL